jgi:manganese-dependent inorganic pyrophosphatase
MEAPELITDVSTQVMDIEIRHTQGIRKGSTLKTAWGRMREDNLVTLPVTDAAGNLDGVITTRDVATSYMDVYDSEMLSRTRTRYRDIRDTLEGEILCGNENACFTTGKVIVGSANPEWSMWRPSASPPEQRSGCAS